MQATHLINVTCATQTEKNMLISIIYNIHSHDILPSQDLWIHIKLAASTHCRQEGYENAFLVFSRVSLKSIWNESNRKS